jgi:hypothetical protein
MNEKLHELQSIRPNVKHEIGYSIEEQILDKYPEYFDKVVEFIQKLGAITERDGHSAQLDDIKNSAYRLIGI